ncbi:MAG: acetyl-CoA carboxylase carboxyltransferase subunit beta [Firmicutes bacterium]|nr:acetyl-CoA carboxylase carboxyltransferase subunit beta [Bacillota bacterium]
MPTLKDFFRSKPKYVTVHPIGKQEKREIPDGLWVKCEECGNLLFNKELERNMMVCPKCGYHYRVSARFRIAGICDEGTFQEFADDLVTADPLGFPAYPEKIRAAQEKTGLPEAVICGTCEIEGFPVVLAVMDFSFIGGSMGSVVGEKVTLAIEKALEEKKPLIIVSTSGGARMQEGILSLMQMAKTSAAIGKLNEAGGLYISVLANPCTAGVMASFASLGDIIIAEPKALVAFAGPRVIEQTVREKLPPGSHRAEFLMEHGLIDLIVDRRDLKETLAKLLRFHAPAQVGGGKADA